MAAIEIAHAQQFLADGDALRAAGQFTDAVNKYKDAVATAESANPLSKRVAGEEDEMERDPLIVHEREQMKRIHGSDQADDAHNVAPARRKRIGSRSS